MTVMDVIRRSLETGAEWARGVAEDMKDAPLTSPTPKGGNHPLWVLGHLAFAEGALSGMINGRPNLYEKWRPLFDMGTEPTTNAADYPPYEEVLTAFTQAREATLRLLDELGDAGLDQKPSAVPEEAAGNEHFQSNGRLLLLIAMHQASHLGQIADARRAAGRKPLFA